jgi:hypothetical protein
MWTVKVSDSINQQYTYIHRVRKEGRIQWLASCYIVSSLYLFIYERENLTLLLVDLIKEFKQLDRETKPNGDQVAFRATGVELRLFPNGTLAEGVLEMFFLFFFEVDKNK